jgi:3-hydroxyacyl-[acyl-carrier-protein] dehydratase
VQPSPQATPPSGQDLARILKHGIFRRLRSSSGQRFFARTTSANFRNQLVPSKDLILDFSEYDLERVIADKEEIRKCNPQRFEMEQLSAIVFDDVERGICVGYRDVSPDEFWVRGHMPGMPLMPGVIMCEAAAQVCSYHVQRHNLLEAEMVGFGGMDDVRFRGTVLPGDRLVVMCQKTQLRPGQMVRCRFQCFVGENLVCEGKIRGIPIPVDALIGRR